MDFVLATGSLGALLVVIGFSLQQLGKLKSDSLAYIALNILGGLFLFLYAYWLSSVPFMILQGVWTVFAVYGLCKILMRA